MTSTSETAPQDAVFLIASGDLRESANQAGWPEQASLESALEAVLAAEGRHLHRAHPYDEARGHGFISSQRMGMDVFQNVPLESPLIVATAVWQYSHHVLAGLRRHRGPILTIANWSGRWPGLVGLLNLNGCLTKSGIPYDTLWSESFDDDFFLQGLSEWLAGRDVCHDATHVRSFDVHAAPSRARAIGASVAERLEREMAILGVFDEGCMGMSNAIIDDELLNPMGIYKERLSQSALLAEMERVSAEAAQEVRTWLDNRGMTFHTGPDEDENLTDAQILEQGKMYIASARMADRFACDAIGIQYQQGLKDMAPASDLVEGLLNDADRPPARRSDGTIIRPEEPIPHFNEVDEGAAVDALVTNRVWRELGHDPSTTLHDVRWGETLTVDGTPLFVWVFQISGAVPASHLEGGYRGAEGHRQPATYFPLGGSTLSGVAKEGEFVWSRVFVSDARLFADVGVGRAVRLPDDETTRRRQATTAEWPIMNAVLHGVTRDQMMARHKANHVQVAYAPDRAAARTAALAKAAAFHAMGIEVHVCGDVLE